MKIHKYLLVVFFILISSILYCEKNEFYNLYVSQCNFDRLFNNKLDFKDFLYSSEKPEINFGIKFSYLNQLIKYEFKKEENLIRRAEILFFGSLTFATFGAWFFFSIFNILIYNEPFGKLRKEQFLPIYLGSSIISVSVVLSDLFVNLKPKIKKIEIY